MDDGTVQAYDRLAADYASDWESQPAPVDLYALLQRYFRPGLTADVGCGSGRDTAWLAARGFDCIGYDASAGLLAEAGRLHPGIRFEPAALPGLAGLERAAFANVLCETVIMHLPPAQIGPSVGRLVALLEPAGTLYVSWRVTDGEDFRDGQGRLYAGFDPALVTTALAPATIVHEDEPRSVSSGRTIHRIVARSALARGQ